MKKYIAFLLCLVMLISLVSCNTANKNKDINNDAVSTEVSNKDDGKNDTTLTDKPTTDTNKQYYRS